MFRLIFLINLLIFKNNNIKNINKIKIPLQKNIIYLQLTKAKQYIQAKLPLKKKYLFYF